MNDTDEQSPDIMKLSLGGYEARKIHNPWVSLFFNGPAAGRFWTTDAPRDTDGGIINIWTIDGKAMHVCIDRPFVGGDKYESYSYKTVAIDTHRKIVSYRLIEEGHYTWIFRGGPADARRIEGKFLPCQPRLTAWMLNNDPDKTLFFDGDMGCRGGGRTEYQYNLTEARGYRERLVFDYVEPNL